MRAFVVGNGPSLKDTDLSLLAGEVSFATNNIHLIYPTTSWRPTHYVRAEQAGELDSDTWLESLLFHIESTTEIHCNLWYPKWLERKGYTVARQRLHVINSCAHYTTNFDSEYCPHMWHLPRLCSFGSSVNVAVQIAVQAGYSPIYLVGCDLGYRDNEPSHFDPNYEHGQEQPARLANLNTLVAHIIAKRSSPQPIFNATLGGELEVYERVEYAHLFSRQRPEFETHSPAFAYR